MPPPPGPTAPAPAGIDVHPSDWRHQWGAIARRLTLVQRPDQLRALIATVTHRPGVTVLAFVNAHSLNSLLVHAPSMQGLAFCDYLLRDGVGVSMLLRMLRLQPGLNLNGTDLIPAILMQRRFERVALFGTLDEVAGKAAATLRGWTDTPQTPCAIETANGFLPPEDYVERALRFEPQCIVLGMGTPKQEQVAALLARRLQHDCVVICGGAILDFMAGRFQRAPRMVRGLRLEWAYRLALEPMRLFRRYIIGNPVFLYRSACVAFTSPAVRPAGRIEPVVRTEPGATGAGGTGPTGTGHS